MLDEKLSRRLA